jgi:hypothetical protein
MPKHHNGTDYHAVGGGIATGATPEQRAEQRRRLMTFCGFCMLVTLGIALGGLITSLTTDVHWEAANETHIMPRKDNVDVEVGKGGNLIVHDSILDSFTHYVYQKITLDPIFGPEGPDLLFGDPGATYARLQAFYALGFRVWDRSFIPIGGPFQSNGLFGQDALAIVIDTFVTWVHGPIIGTGPAIMVISDESVKENVKSLDPAASLSNVAGLEPRSFDYKDASQGSATIHAKVKKQMTGLHGFIAQEVDTVIPAAVHSTADYLDGSTNSETGPSMSLLDYNAIITELVGAVQSLWANGVLNAASVFDQMDNGGAVGQQIAPCFNTTNYPTTRTRARCICNLKQCGKSAPNAPINIKCLDLAAACGGPEPA